jgi:hypothetical protein
MAAPTLTLEPTITGEFFVSGTVTVTAGTWSVSNPDGGYRIRLFSTNGTELIDTGYQPASSIDFVLPVGVEGTNLLANTYAKHGGEESNTASSAYSIAIGPAPTPEPEPTGPGLALRRQLYMR